MYIRRELIRQNRLINNSLMSLAVDIIYCRAKFLSGYPYACICEEIS